MGIAVKMFTAQINLSEKQPTGTKEWAHYLLHQ